MPSECGFRLCRNIFKEFRLPLFTPPKDEEERKIWFKNVPFPVSDTTRLCILHFPPDVVKKARLERRRPDVPPENFDLFPVF